jgi:hypothetical protein
LEKKAIERRESLHQYLVFKRLKGEKSGITPVKQTPKAG